MDVGNIPSREREYAKSLVFSSNDKDPAYLSKISVKSRGRPKSSSDSRSRWRREIEAAVVIQRAYRSYYSRNIERFEFERKATQLKAARLIWKTWTSYRMKKQFYFYRNLIDVSGKLDPYYILKTINPKEQNFPPNIYYKIGTYRPIVDLCALSPRDYAGPTYCMSSAKDRHNKPTRKPSSSEDKKDWYERYENNGWRLATDTAHVVPVYQDFITIESSQRQRHFHYSKLVRRQDLEKRRKEHKLAWIMKM